jgi:hypothetical protein
VLAREPVQACQDRIGRAVYIDRIRFQAQFLSVDTECLQLVEQDNSRATNGELGDGLFKQLHHRLLTSTKRRAGERVRIDFDITGFHPRQVLCDLIGKTSREGGLSCPGRPL